MSIDERVSERLPTCDLCGKRVRIGERVMPGAMGSIPGSHVCDRLVG